MTPEVQELRIALGDTSGFWAQWMGLRQRAMVIELLAGEEGHFYFEKLTELKARIEQMPQTYDNQNNGVEDPVCHIRYFGGNVTIYVAEKDMGDTGTWRPTDPQHQAWGLVQILPNYPETGYISLPEILSLRQIDMDFHFNPITLSQARKDCK